MVDWQHSTLGKIADAAGGVIQTGPFGSQLHQEDYTSEGVPVVMPKDIVEGRVNDESIARINNDDAARLGKHRLFVGDIVYGRRGDIGRQALIRKREEGWLCGTGCLRVSINSSIVDPVFLHYFLRLPPVIQWISNQAIGATMPNLNTSILRSLPVTFPPFPEQRRIAGILSAYDDLIENCERRIRVLDEMARALYREWFLDLRSPGRSHRRGLRPGVLGELLTLHRGYDLPERERLQGEVPIVSSSGSSGTHSVAKVQPPCIVTGRYGTLGEVFFMDVPCWPLNTTLYVSDFKGTDPYYAFFLLRSLDLAAQNSAGAVPGVNRNALHLLPISVPDSTTQATFGGIVAQHVQLGLSLTRQARVLRSTRDLLLPRLLSGDLSVEDAA
jgi:type I restriction enzyme S subunit